MMLSCSNKDKIKTATNEIIINLAPEPLTMDPTLNTDNLTMIYRRGC